jgi:hypothetical protein
MNLETTQRCRPRYKWQDEVREDGRITGEEWQEKVRKEELKKLLRMATNHHILHMSKE